MEAAVPALPAKLLAHARHTVLAPGDLVFSAGARARAVWFLASGGIRLVRYGRNGEEVPIHQALAGEFFAEASLHSDRYHCSAVATRPGRVLELPSAAMKELLANDLDFSREWIATLSRQLRGVRARVERLCLKSAQERVRHLLLTEGTGPRCRYELPGTLKDLAASLGLTHEALYRTLADMQRRGQIARTPETLSLNEQPD